MKVIFSFDDGNENVIFMIGSNDDDDDDDNEKDDNVNDCSFGVVGSFTWPRANA